MKIGIHHRKHSFSAKWIDYCKRNQVEYKVVNCYDNDIIKQLADCDGLMWHFHHTNPKDTLFAKQLTYALQAAGKVVFPDFRTAWHFDDKVGQKYLLESIDAPLVPSYVFYDQQKALEWVEKAKFPKVFKLRRGAGGAHVELVEKNHTAKDEVLNAFKSDVNKYNKMLDLIVRLDKSRYINADLCNVVNGLLRYAKTTEYAKVAGPERGYVYFLDFIPNNGDDLRIKV